MEYKWLKAPKYRKLSVEEKLEILKELELNTPAILDWLITSHEAAVLRDAKLNYPWAPSVLATWRGVAGDLRDLKDKYFGSKAKAG